MLSFAFVVCVGVVVVGGCGGVTSVANVVCAVVVGIIDVSEIGDRVAGVTSVGACVVACVVVGVADVLCMVMLTLVFVLV